MRRYLSKDKSRFWEVDASPDGLTIRNGAVGKAGRKSFKAMSETEAQTLADKRIADKLKLGFTLVGSDEVRELRDPGLEETIAGDPTNPAGYQIYADWLQEQGEPRGQLIALDVEASSEALEKKIAKARRAFLKANPGYDLPPRFGELATKKGKKAASAGTVCNATWRHGFVAEVEVGIDPKAPHSLLDLLGELFSHPSARFLQSLTIGSLGEGRVFDYSSIAARIASEAPRSLRRLVIARFDEDSCDLRSSRIDGLPGLLAALPQLRELELRVGEVSLEPLAHPSLVRLSIDCCAIGEADLAAIGGAALPALESLRIDAKDAPLRAAALGPLFTSPPDGLRSLALTHSQDTEATVTALVTSPLGGQLETLDVSFGDLTRLFSTSALSCLATLDVTGNYLPDDAEATLSAEVETLRFVPQRENLVGYRTVTMAQVRDFAPDGKSVTAARKVAKVSAWPRLGRAPEMLWGECAGSSRYQAFVRLGDAPTDAACTCPSRKYPCKHVLALLLFAAEGLPMPREEAPRSLVSSAESARYDTAWE